MNEEYNPEECVEDSEGPDEAAAAPARNILRFQIDLDAGRLKELAGQVRAVLPGLEAARDRQAVWGCEFHAGNPSFFPTWATPIYELIEMMVRFGMPNHCWTWQRHCLTNNSPLLNALVEQGQVGQGEIRTAVMDLVTLVIEFERQYYGERGSQGLHPAITDDYVRKFADLSRRLDGMVAGHREAASHGQSITDADVIEGLRKRSVMQATLFEMLIDGRSIPFEDVIDRVWGKRREDVKSETIRQLVYRLNESLMTLGSGVHVSTHAEHVMKENLEK